MTMNCGHCGTAINTRSWSPLYRTCDAYVCSPACSRARMHIITKLDPNLTQPMEWANTCTIDPPKSFKRKSSFIALNNLDLANDVDIHLPIIPECEDQENLLPIHNPAPPVYPRNTILDTIANTASTVCMTAFALGIFLLAT